MAIDTERFRTALVEERTRIAAALEYLHAENPGSIRDETDEIPVDNHMGDTAAVTLDREIDYSLEENSGHVLAEIDAALARLDDGTFGTCRTCGNPIGEERLEAIPYATQCIDCKRRAAQR